MNSIILFNNLISKKFKKDLRHSAIYLWFSRYPEWSTSHPTLLLKDQGIPQSNLALIMPYTSTVQHCRILFYKHQNWSDRTVTRRVHVDHTMVSHIHQQYRSFKNVDEFGKKSGRPRKLTDSEIKKAVQLILRGKVRNITHLWHEYFPSVSTETLWRCLKELGFWAPVPCLKPLLNQEQCIKQLQWAWEHKTLIPDQWRSVIFSDEKKFNLFGSDGR